MSKPAKKKKPSAPKKTPRAGKGGVIPPVDQQFKKGPDPRRGPGDTARAIVTNYLNGLARREATVAQLLKIKMDPKSAALKRAAAEKLLDTFKHTTLADFEDWLDGTKTLEELAADGVDVSMLAAAEVIEMSTKEGSQTRRRVKLLENAGENFDRIMGHTGLAPSEVEKYNRVDNGLATERIESVVMEVVGPSRQTPKE